MTFLEMPKGSMYLRSCFSERFSSLKEITGESTGIFVFMTEATTSGYPMMIGQL